MRTISPDVRVQILPNPQRLYSSLRNSGYSNLAAIADLVDNPIDADASKIKVSVLPSTGRVSKTPDFRIVVSDDGTGMTYDQLVEALKLGSDLPKDDSSDLGKFGMGLITASISIARQLQVYTKTPDGKLMFAQHDLDVVSRDFYADVREATKHDEHFWSENTINPDHGTIVVLRNCDQTHFEQIAPFCTELRKYLGEVFRIFIASKSRRTDSTIDWFITLNDQPVYVIDPLWSDNLKPFIDPQTPLPEFGRIVEDIPIDDIPVDPQDPTKGNETVRLRIAELPALTMQQANQFGISQSNQGIYVLRNNRQIEAAQTLGTFTRHNGLNRFRAELFLPGTLDKRTAIDWTKQKIHIDQSLKDRLEHIIRPHTATLKKRETAKVTAEKKVNHDIFENLIRKKGRLLIAPPRPRVERHGGNGNGKVTPKDTSNTLTGTGRPTIDYAGKVLFKEVHLSAAGAIWDTDREGTKIIISFNVDHPLWETYILQHEDPAERKSVLELLHLMSYALATAEYTVFGEDDFERMINLRSILSTNLRVLLT